MVDRSHLRGSKPRRMRPKIFLLHETQLLKVHVARVGTSVSGQLVPGYTEGGVERCREHADIETEERYQKGELKKETEMKPQSSRPPWFQIVFGLHRVVSRRTVSGS